MNKKLVPMHLVIALILLSSWTLTPQNASAETSSGPGLPFTEDFTDTALRDARETNSILLADVDADGNLDMLAGNREDTNRLYLNNGTAVN